MTSLPEEDAWGDLLDGIPDLGLLDDMQLDCVLGDVNLPPGLDLLDGLDCLGLGTSETALGAGAAVSAGSRPATSDLLDSLQLDVSAFAEPASSSDAGHSPSRSGSDSPVTLPLVGGTAALPPLPPVPLAGGTSRSSPATSESENNGERRGPSLSGSRGTVAAPAASGQQGVAQHAALADQQAARQHLTDDEKRLARMQRNRENAQLSRLRKKQQVTELESRCSQLSQQNVQLTAAVQRLTAENATLRQQLALICQQAGRNAAAAGVAGKPAAAGAPTTEPKPAGASTQPTAAVKPTAKPAGTPSAAPAAAPAKPAGPRAAPAPTGKPAAQPVAPAAAAAGAAAAAAAASSATAAAAAAVAARGLLPQWPLLPFGFLPKVGLPVQQARPGQPAPGAQPSQPKPAGAAPTNTKLAAAPAPTPAAQQGGRAPKRARTAAGASTAFLALFTLFMFAGPFSPAPVTTPSSTGGLSHTAGVATGGQRMLQALPDTALAIAGGGSNGDGGLRRAGRGLRALPAASADSSALQHPQFGPLPQHPRPHAEAALSGHGGNHLQQLLNSTLQALLLEPGNAQLEAAALQRLQELGPVALLLDADVPGAAAGSNPLAASAAFPRLADQLFGSAGLEVPQVCQKVLEFDAASVPHAVRSRRSLERYVLGSTGFKGRSLAGVGGPAAAALPAGAQGDGGAAQHAQRGQQTIRISEEAYDEEDAADLDGEQHPRGDASSAASGLLPTGSASGAPVLVSVLLPANASGGVGGGHKLTAVDKVFVVLLHPAERYTTYSCALPRAVVL